MANDDIVTRLTADTSNLEQGLARSREAVAKLGQASVITSSAFRDAVGVGNQIRVTYDDLAASARRAGQAASEAAERSAAAAQREQEYLRETYQQRLRVQAVVRRGDEESAERARQASGAAAQGVQSASGSIMAALAPIGGAVAAAFSVQAVAGFARESIRAAAEAEDSFNRLRSAMMAQGQGGMTASLAQLAGELQATTRYSDDAIMSMQALAARIGVPAASMADFTKAAVDMAAALQIDVAQAGDMLAKTLDGDAGKLKQLIPEFENLDAAALKAGQGIDLVASKFSGAATQDAQSLSGSLGQLSTAWGELKEAVGFAIVEISGAREAAGGVAEALGTGATSKVRELSEGIRMEIDLLRELGSAIDSAAGEGRLERLFQLLNPVSSKSFFNTAVERITAAGSIGEVFTGVDLEGAKFGAENKSDAGGKDAAAEKAREIQARINRSQAENEELARKSAAAAERAADAAAREAESIARAATERAKQVDYVQSAAGVAGQQVALADRVATSEAHRQELLTGIVGQLESARKQAWEVAKVVDMTDLAYQSTVGALDDQIGATRELIALSQERSREEAAAREAAVRGDMFSDAEADDTTTGPNVTKQDKEISQRARAKEDSEVRELAALSESLGSVTLARQQHNEQIAYESELKALIAAGRDTEAEALMLEHKLTSMSAGKLAGLVVSLGDVSLARQEMAIAQAEATLQHKIETGALDALTEAGEREIATRMRSINAMKAGAKQQAESVRWANLSRAAKVQEVGAEINGALSSVAAVTKSTKAKIAIQATQSVINGIIETAKAASSYASGNAVAGTAHAISAATFFYAATQAGASGGSGAGGASGGGGTGRDREDAPSRTDDFSSTRQRAEEGQRMPAISVVFTGNGIIAGTTPEAFASAVTPFIQEVVRESGGREGSVRG